MKCGLLGKSLKHSYSPQIHSKLSDYSYELFEKSESEVESFVKNGDFCGINVTIPYKKTVIPFCDELSATAKAIGSVNTIVRKDGKIYGDNTDYYGFLYTVKKSGISVADKKVIVLGSGGASVTVQSVLKELEAREIVVISRNGKDNYDNITKHFDADIIVNTTPVGMYPNNLVSPIDISKFTDCKAVFDLIYNPALTKLLLDAKKHNIPYYNGLSMLVAQAAKSSELFTENRIDDIIIEATNAELSVSMKNIILVGMPGCGKTYIGKRLAECLNREFIDIDKEIEKAENITIPEIFSQFGERHFRKTETKVLSEFCKCSSMVISTGGGAVTISENFDIIKQNGIVIWLKRDLYKLSREGRPLSANADFEQMYKNRAPLYEKYADIIVENNNANLTIANIKEKLNENSCT